ncbi:MAG: exodeoxyribonuclease V subunit gamma, partial [Bacteroidota bacterium]
MSLVVAILLRDSDIPSLIDHERVAMLTDYTSHSLRLLADRLGHVLLEEAPADPLTPRTILIPNRDVSRWLSMELTRTVGVVANLQMVMPSEWVWQASRQLYPDLPERLPSDPGPMSWTLYRILQDSAFRKEVPVLDRWIASRGENPRSIWLLARRIVSLLDGYQVYRPEMLLAWDRNERVTGSRDELWQRKVWQRLRREWERKSPQWSHTTRPDLLAELLSNDGETGGDDPGKAESGENDSKDEGPLFLFHPGLLPRSVEQLIRHRARKVPVWRFQVRPDAWSSPEGLNLDLRPENPLLTQLGRQWMEQLTMARELDSEMPVEVRRVHLSGTPLGSEEPSGGGDSEKEPVLLRSLQESIRRAEPLPTGLEPDDSVEVHSCHSPLRELEVLHDALLRKFDEMEDLRPDEIAIVTPDPDRYRQAIEAVFTSDREWKPEIPLFLPRSGGGERLKAAFRALLQVPESRLTLPELTGLLERESVRAWLGLSTRDLQQVRRWLKENRVAWGVNEAHWVQEGLGPETRKSWQAALDRGWLGQWSATEPGTLVDGDLAFVGIESREQREIWARLQQFLGRLDRWRAASLQSRSLGDWVELIDRSLLEPLAEPEGESGAKQAIREMLEQIREEGELAGAEADEIGFDLVRERLLEELDRGSVGTTLHAETIQFHSMVPMRSIPFRVIAILGLDDGVYPRPGQSGSEDLLGVDHQPGERDHRLEDRALFLEAILAAGECLYCSYVGRSRKDDEALPPSVILTEWIEAVSGATGTPDEQIIRHERLNGFSATQFREGTPGHEGIWSDVALRIEMFNHQAGMHVGSPLRVEKPAYQLQELVSFAKSPTDWYIQTWTGARLREEEEREADLFKGDFLTRYQIRSQWLERCIQGWPREQIESMIHASGWLPDGVDGAYQLSQWTGPVDRMIERLQARKFTLEKVYSRYSKTLQEKMITGDVESYSKEGFLDLHTTSAKSKHLRASYLRYLFHLLNAKGEPEEGTVAFLEENGKEQIWRMHPPADPGRELERWVERMEQELERRPEYPIESAWKWLEKVAPDQSEEWADPDEATDLVGLKAAWEAWDGYNSSERAEGAMEGLVGRNAPLDETLVRQLGREWLWPVYR